MGVSLAGNQFVTLDKAIAARARDLLSRDSLTFQDVQEWQTDFNQLQIFAESHADDRYIAQGWSEEKPRYANVVSWLMAKVQQPVRYTSSLYNEDLPFTSQGCGCNGNDYGSGDNSGVSLRPATVPHNTVFPLPNVGDAARNYFGLPDIGGHYSTPQVNAPLGGGESIPTSNILQYLLLAGILGALLWAVYKVSKKNA